MASLLTAEPQRELRIIGSARHPIATSEFQQRITAAFPTPAPTVAASIAARARYVQADPLDHRQLADLIASLGDGPLVIYFALPPAITVRICAELAQLQLPADTRLALEKPFGSDEDTARELNQQLRRVVPEAQIYRVDHFLGTATVLNLIGLRFANRVLQPVWSGQHIERVEISYDEDLTLEGRAAYYDQAGALKDMLQSHLLQILSLFAMETPASLEPTELHDLQAQVLRATHVWNHDPVQASRRGRYTAGEIHGTRVPAYIDESGVDPTNNTETLAQVTLAIDNNRWNGVPITLRSGKALGEPSKRIVCTFRPVPHIPHGFHQDDPRPDQLIIGLKPGNVRLELSMNDTSPLQLTHKQLTADLGAAAMTAYGEVLRHILDGEQLLAVRADIAEQSWRVFAPVIQAFRDNLVPLENYTAGSAGLASTPGEIRPRE